LFAAVMAIEFITALRQKKASTMIQYGQEEDHDYPHYLSSKEPGKRLLPRYPTSLAKSCVSLYILRQEIAQKRPTLVLLPRYWPRLLRPSLPQSLPSYRPTLPTN
jgi:hypothetical protein